MADPISTDPIGSRGAGRLKRVGVAFALVVASVFLCLLIAELGWRAAADDVAVFRLRNYAEEKLSLFQSRYPSAYDPDLGWVPLPGYQGTRDNFWKQPVTIDGRGLRIHAPPPEGPLVLAVGDSFTFGDEVGDKETYPAHLQAQLGWPVINAGVFGYGFDQTVLRAERLLDRFDPRIVVIQAVTDDVHRMQMSKRSGVAKPYFALNRDHLELKNVPAPHARPSVSEVGFIRRVFGYSYLVDWSMRRLGHAEWWYVGNWPHAFAHQDKVLATDIACRLVKRLGKRLEVNDIKAVFVAQYAKHVIAEAPYENSYTQPVRSLVKCAAQAGFQIVDTYPIMRPISESEPNRFGGFYRVVHFSSAGNAFLAERIVERVRYP